MKQKARSIMFNETLDKIKLNLGYVILIKLYLRTYYNILIKFMKISLHKKYNE